MREFLRKNGKIIMTILSVALMFVFAMPGMKPKTADDIRGAPVGKLNGKAISTGTLREYDNELKLLRQLRVLPPEQAQYPAPANYPTSFPQTAIALQDIAEEDQAVYWMLLCKEAAQYSQSFATFEQAASYSGDPGDVQRVLGTFGTNAEIYVKIFERLEGVETYLHHVLDVPKPVSQLEYMGDRAIRKVLVTFATIDGKEGWQTVGTPTDAEISAQFAAYKGQLATPFPKEPRTFSDGVHDFTISDTDRGMKVTITERATKTVLFDDLWSLEAATKAGVDNALMARVLALASPAAQPAEINGHRYPFGYRYPDRVQVEWLMLKRADIRAKVPPGEKADMDAYVFVKENPSKVREMIAAEAARKAATQPAPATQADATTTSPATQVAATASALATTVASTQTAPATRPLTTDELFAQAYPLLMDMQADASAEKVINRMRDQVTTRAAAPWKGDVAPAPGAWVNYDTIAKVISESPDFYGYKPEHGNSGRLMSAAELAELPGIGDSLATVAQQLVPFRIAATSVKEVATLEKDSLLARLGLQKGAEGPVMRDAAGNLYIYRVIEAEKSHEPANVDETVKPGVTVKSLVIEDLKKLKTFENRLQETKDAAAKGGDISIVSALFKARVRLPEAFSRLDAERRELPLDVAGIRGFPEKAFGLKADAKGVTVFEDEEQLNIEALSLAKFLDATGMDFARGRLSWIVAADPKIGSIAQDVYGRIFTVPGDLGRDYLSLEAIAARLKYVPDGGFKKRTP